VGIAMIKSFQRGTTIMNINHSDIAEMEIPLLPDSRQQEIILQHENEFSSYKETINQAENRWVEVKTILYNKLI
jgi:restriction endonuclease S subunit